MTRQQALSAARYMAMRCGRRRWVLRTVGVAGEWHIVDAPVAPWTLAPYYRVDMWGGVHHMLPYRQWRLARHMRRVRKRTKLNSGS